MPIQFQCPQGHLLQGDEAHMGMQTQCPYCAMMFIIPVIDTQALQATYQPQYAPHYAPEQYVPQPESHIAHEDIYEPVPQPGLRDFLSQVAADEVGDDVPADHVQASRGIDFESPSAAPGEAGCVHIPCPNGHELETPYDMLGQEVLCPHCNAQFRLRNEDSREYQAKIAKRDAEAGKAWFNWAIAAAILLGGGLLMLLAIALSK